MPVSNKKRAVATTEGEPPAKKQRKGYKCPVSTPEWLAGAEPFTFKLQAEPKGFLSGGYGWHCYKVMKIEADGPDSTKLNDKEVLTQVTCTMNVLSSKTPNRGGGLTKAQFVKAAPRKQLSLEGLPYEFSTGSFGWAMNKKQDIKVDGKNLRVQVNLNALVRGSKPDGPMVEADEDGPLSAAALAEDPDLAKIDPKDPKLKRTFSVIGRARRTQKDNLKEIKGIGPFIERRVNRIGIYTFEQIAKMTKEIEDDVNEAIIYFPGRVRRDDWVGQAKEFAAKKERKNKKA